MKEIKGTLFSIVVFIVLCSPLILIANDKRDEAGILSSLQSIEITIDTNMVYVKGGSFQMGYDHKVTLTYDFYIGKYEVTFDEWNVYHTDMPSSYDPSDEGWGRGRRPVINLNWYDAITFCNWLSDQQGLPHAYDDSGNLLDASGNITIDITKVKGYRLPTEAEWEYTARNKGKRAGDQYSGSGNADLVAWYKDNSGIQTHPVGEKLANELGIYDMSGNVWEWCHDGYESYIADDRTNPIGSLYSSYRVIRGGSFNYEKILLLPSYRFYHYPSIRHDYIGFRLARTTN